MQFRALTTSQTASRSLAARPLITSLLLSAATLVATASVIAARAPGAAPSSTAVQASGALPIAVGAQIAGTFRDATGHSAQSHLIYAANARVWWLFTLTSNADAEGGSNHIVKSFHSSGPDLATATWIAGADSPPAVASTPNQFLGGGRSLGVAYLNNSPIDVIHADISMAFDGQDGRTGHIRAVVTGTSITWSSWNYFDEPAATWTLPRGNTVGVSSGKFIHTGGPILQQEVDANVRKSTNADTGATWTSGFSVPVVIDNSMLNQDNALAFAPLASNAMLAVYDNGQNVEPKQTNLRYKRSDANGTWSGPVVGSQLGGDGDVFSTTAVIDQNDWGLVSVNASQIYVFRRKANGSGVDAATYNVATNTWSALAPAPPAFSAGQSFKSGAGLFGATDGAAVWVCVINTDLANSILCTRFDGTAWTPWAVVPGTDVGIQNRNYISGSPRVGNNQIGLIWTEGTSLYDVVTYSFDAAPDATAPTVSLTSPANGATVSGTVAISATATDNVGVAGVQFTVDGVSLGPEITSPPYSVAWNTAASANGTHTLAAIARDDAGNTATAAATSVTVSNTVNISVPNVVGFTQAAASAAIAAAGLTVGTVNSASSATVPSGSVISQSPSGGTQVAANSTVSLVVSSGPAPVAVPNVVGLTQVAATTAITNAGLVVGTVTAASSATVPAGSVISQTPAAPTQVAVGSAVSLVVSSGPVQVAVPDVVGLTQAAATTAIAGAGLKLGPLTTTASNTVPSGSVISQTPVAGAQVASGTAVALVVSSGPIKVAVPNVVGLTQSAATTAIANAGLVVGAVTTAASASVAAGSVISQTPAADTQVASGSAVALVVSSGPPQVAVPNVVGLTQAAATAAITNAGLVIGAVTTASSASVPAGSVISQTPAANTQIASGSAVGFVVSSGPPQVAVPDVVGLTQADATSAIAAAGLKVGALTMTASNTVPSGSVISQTPTAGAQVASGTTVALVVSSGPLKVTVPNVLGLTQAAATAAITNAGLVIGAVTTASSASVPAGSVISQTPAADTQVASGSAVALVVSSGPPQVAVPSVVGLTQGAATVAISNAGLVVGAVTTASSASVPPGTVISQTPVADTQVASGSAVALVVSSGPLQVAAPNVVGLTQVAATAAITSANLVVGTVTTSPSATVPAGIVISQTPAAATQVVVGSAVSLIVSSGAPPPAPPSNDEIVLYAASAPVVAGQWSVVADATAAGGSRMQSVNAGAPKITQALVAPVNYFEITFTADAGKPYRLWLRGIALNNDFNNDSVFVQFDGSADAGGAPIYRIGTTAGAAVVLEDCFGCGVHGWGWQDNAYGVNALGPVIYFAQSGPQRLRVQTREDGLGIDQIVLSAVKYITQAPGALKDDTTKLPATAPPPPPANDEVVLYAASAPVVAGQWSVVADATAADGSRMQSLNVGAAKITQALAAPVNYFELTFTADAGKPYRLWLRGIAQNNDYNNDSVFVQFDGSADVGGAPIYRIGTTAGAAVVLEDCFGCGVQGWGWQDDGYGLNVLGPVIYFAQSGPQRLRVQTREDGLGIDQIVLSAVKYLTQAPGAVKNDTTILPR